MLTNLSSSEFNSGCDNNYTFGASARLFNVYSNQSDTKEIRKKLGQLMVV